MGLIDHEVRPLDVQDGLVLGDGSQVLVAQHLIVHLGLKGNGGNGTDVTKGSPGIPVLRTRLAMHLEENGWMF